MEGREPTLSPLLGAGLVFVILLAVGLRSPQPWSATGLAFVTFAAFLASPELLGRLLMAAHHPFPRAVARVIGWPFRLIRLAIRWLFAVACVVLLALVVLDRAGNGALAATIVLGIVFGYVEFTRWELGDIVKGVTTGGHIDRKLEERFGSSTRLLVAGLFFLTGTILQVVATYIEQ